MRPNYINDIVSLCELARVVMKLNVQKSFVNVTECFQKYFYNHRNVGKLILPSGYLFRCYKM